MSRAPGKSPLFLEGLSLLLGGLAVASAVPAVVQAWLALAAHTLSRPDELPLSPVVSALVTLLLSLPSLGFAGASVLIRRFVARD